MVVAHINSTGRKKINRDVLQVVMLPHAPGSAPKVKASVSSLKKDRRFPPAAKVVIEALRKVSMVRFECGTIGDLHVPKVLDLAGIDPGGAIKFRLKVVDADGLILGLTPDVVLKADGRTPSERESLLPVMYRPLGQKIWEVSGDIDETPYLWINSEIPDLERRFSYDLVLRSAIISSAVEIVLRRVAAAETSEDPDDWRARWLRYCREVLSADEYPAGGTYLEISQWVDECTVLFANKHRLLDGVRTYLEENSDA